MVRKSSLGPRKAGPGRGWLGWGEQRKPPEVASLGRGPTEGMGDWRGASLCPFRRAGDLLGQAASQQLGVGAAQPGVGAARRAGRSALHAPRQILGTAQVSFYTSRQLRHLNVTVQWRAVPRANGMVVLNETDSPPGENGSPGWRRGAPMASANP